MGLAGAPRGLLGHLQHTKVLAVALALSRGLFLLIDTVWAYKIPEPFV